MDVSALRALSLYELDNIAGLEVGNDADTPKGQEILTGLRDAVIEMNDADRWDVPRRRAGVIHEVVDSNLISPMTRDRVAEFAIVAAAWDIDLEGFRAYAGAFMDTVLDIYDLDGETTGTTAISRALYLAYTQAVRDVVAWLEENQPEEEDED